MMGAQLPSLLFLVVVLVWRTDGYCVGNSSTSYQGEDCMDINTYANSPFLYFKSNTTFYFLKGTHVLNSQMSLFDIENISFVGVGGVESMLYPLDGSTSVTHTEPLSRIQISSYGGMYVSNVNGLTITNIAFIGSGLNAKSVTAISLFSVSNLLMDGVSIQNVSGYGIYNLLYLQSAMIVRSSFVNINGTALRCSSCSLTIDHTEFLGCSTTGITSANSYIPMTHCTFANSSIGIQDLGSSIGLSACRFQGVNISLLLQGSTGTVIAQSEFRNFISAGIISMSEITLWDCTFSEGRRSTIYASGSSITFLGNVNFWNGNSAGKGGALYLSSDSTILLQAIITTTVSFINNTALLGGAIYVKHRMSDGDNCFFSLFDSSNNISNPRIHLQFQGNKATEAGGDIYATLNCLIVSNPYVNAQGNASRDILQALSGPAQINIAADPLVVCVTLNEKAQSACSNNQSHPLYVVLYPGQSASLFIVTIDEYNGSTPAVVAFVKSDGTLYDSVMTAVNGTIYDLQGLLLNTSLGVVLQDVYTSATYDHGVSIVIHVPPCPIGFMISPSIERCVCNSFLDSLNTQNIKCTVSNLLIQKSNYSWVGYSSSGALAYFGQCALDYCTGSESVDLRYPDDQCYNNHSGVLCTGCMSGLSQVFGRPLCRACDNTYLLLIIPFAIMGIVLVIALFVLDMTVSNGTTSGFIFYANIVKISDDIFQPSTNSNTFVQILSIFVSWLNLDFGIVTCFYNGMDSYAKTMLQFAFPTYILLLAGIMIVLARYSALVSRVFRWRNNVVPVLATMVLMSYAKAFKTSIAILSYATVNVGGDNASDFPYEVVWRLNGSVRFAEDGHVALLFAGIAVIVLFIIPYSLLLLFTPLIQTKSHWKVFCLVNKLKPFIDSYEGPYAFRHRFWPGLLLMARVVIYLFTASLQQTNASIVLIIIIVIAVGLVVYLAHFGVYRKWQYCTLEMFLHSNLAILCALSLAVQSDRDYGLGAQSLYYLHIYYAVFVGMTFVCFWGVVLVQVHSIVVKLKPSFASPAACTVNSTDQEKSGDQLPKSLVPKQSQLSSASTTIVSIDEHVLSNRLSVPLLREELLECTN